MAIPSKGRAGLTTTQKVLPNATWYVPESELHQYKPIYRNVIGVPLSVRGITATRNWILQNTDSRWVVFIDDDAKHTGWSKLHKEHRKDIKCPTEEFWHNEFIKCFDIAEQMGYKIWGIKTETSTRSVQPYKPFLLRGYVTASCMGMINDGEYYFDESYKVKEDYELCLRHIKEKGGILGVRYVHWENDHWDKDGGCKDYRTQDMERDAIKRLIKQYPGMIRSAKRKANEFTIQLQ